MSGRPPSDQPPAAAAATVQKAQHDPAADAPQSKTPPPQEAISKLAGDEDHNSRSERLLLGNKSVAGLGSQTSLALPGKDQSLLTSAPTFAIGSQPPPHIHDHELLCPIGQGSYGEVWLARSAVGTLRAVKIVRRQTFERTEHFEREFKGLQKFEPVSRSHDGLVDVLHIGRDDAAGYFYYVMELADAVGTRSTASHSSLGINARPHPGPLPQGEGGTSSARRQVGALENAEPRPAVIPSPGGEGQGEGASTQLSTQTPLNYVPRTLRADLQTHGPLPVAECVRIGLALASALEHLHAHGLVHRDIKPSNIIFVCGTPKLADIGLVAHIDDARSLVGTAGYIPPEGPGTPQADLYSLGKVLYEISLGKDRQDFPQLPPDLQSHPDHAALLELNEVTLKACESDIRNRYQTAGQLRADLELLRRGESVKRKRAAGRLFVVARNSFVALAVVAAIIWGSFHYFTTRKSVPYMPRMSVNGEANDLYYKGLHLYQKEGASTLGQAIHYLRQAIEKDPKFALAHARLGGALRLSVDNPDWDLRKARHHAETALALDQNLAEAHEVLAWVKFKEDWDWLGSEREFKRAIELTPNISTPHEWYGVFLVQMGRFDEGIRELQQAQAIDPVSLEIRTFLGTAYAHSHQDRLALAELSAVIDLETNTPSVASMNLATLHEFRGEFEQAIATNARRDALANRDPIETARRYDELRRALAANGPTGYWRAKLAWAKTNSDPFSLACIYAQSGDTDNAIASLETAFAQHSYNLGSYVMMTRALESIRSDPRFDALLRKMKLR